MRLIRDALREALRRLLAWDNNAALQLAFQFFDLRLVEFFKPFLMIVIRCVRCVWSIGFFLRTAGLLSILVIIFGCSEPLFLSVENLRVHMHRWSVDQEQRIGGLAEQAIVLNVRR